MKYNYFWKKNVTYKKDIIPVASQFNLYMDEENIPRVQSRFNRRADHSRYKHPILLSKNSFLTSLIIRYLHENKGHVGVYSALNELCRTFIVALQRTL